MTQQERRGEESEKKRQDMGVLGWLIFLGVFLLIVVIVLLFGFNCNVGEDDSKSFNINSIELDRVNVIRRLNTANAA